MERKIYKNSLYLLCAQTVVKLISFGYTVFLARSLGVENYGLYIAALTYFSLVSSIGDFGINRYLIREVARERSNLQKVLSNVVFLRLTVLSVLYAIFSLVLYNFDPDKMRVALSLLAVMAVLPQSIALTLDAIFVGMENLLFSSIGLLSLSVINTAMGVVLVRGGDGAMGAVTALIFSQIGYVLALLLLLFAKKTDLSGRVNGAVLKEVLAGSLPYGVLGMLGLLYFRIDTLLLSYLKGNFDTGIYGAAYKFLEAIVFVPSALSTALFPVLARLHETDIPKVKKLYFKSLKVLGGLSLLVLAGFILVLPGIIKIFLPNYIQSVGALYILSFTIPFMFLHIPAAVVLLSTDRYLKPVIKLSFLTLSFNVVLNLLLIPGMGYIGASLVTVASELFTFVVFFALLQVKVFKSS